MSFDPRSGGQHETFGPSFRDPFSPQPPQPPRSGTSWMWLLGCGGLMFLLCCGGGVAVMTFGFSVITSQVKDQVRDNPKFREHIGEVQEFELDWGGSFSGEADDSYRYRVRGTKGAGELTVKWSPGPDGQEMVNEAELRLADGTTVQVVP